MADNITLPGTGSAVATDDVGGVQYQRMKLSFGVDGAASDVNSDNPLPVIKSDCVTLLNTSVSAAGTTSSIDTLGFGALVVQVSGVWDGSCYFEASNDGVNWDTVMVFSRDNLCLQDILTQTGLYTIRPSGRYVHLVVTNVAGTMNINAIGRSAEGISAADLLSLAMDRNNNTPMHVSLDDMTVGRIAPAQPLTQIGFYANSGVIVINTLLMAVDCSNYASLSLQYSVGTTGVVTPQWSNDGETWFAATTYDATLNAATTLAAGTGLRFVNVMARYFRLALTTATTAGTTLAVLMGGQRPFANTPTTQAVTVSSGTVTTVTTVSASTPATPTASILSSAATTNGTVVKATAGTIYGFCVSNTGAAAAFFKLHNSATVTVGTTAVALTVSIPASGTVFVDFGPMGMRYGTGICFSITNLAADTDTTAIAANQVKVNLSYI